MKHLHRYTTNHAPAGARFVDDLSTKNSQLFKQTVGKATLNLWNHFVQCMITLTPVIQGISLKQEEISQSTACLWKPYNKPALFVDWQFINKAFRSTKLLRDSLDCRNSTESSGIFRRIPRKPIFVEHYCRDYQQPENRMFNNLFIVTNKIPLNALYRELTKTANVKLKAQCLLIPVRCLCARLYSQFRQRHQHRVQRNCQRIQHSLNKLALTGKTPKNHAGNFRRKFIIVSNDVEKLLSIHSVDLAWIKY